MTAKALCVLTGGMILLTAGCGSSQATPSRPPSTPAPTVTHVRIVEHPGGDPDAFYRPDPITVHLGDAITWTNYDSDPHDATADNGAFASGPIANGSSYTWVPRKAGAFTYFCTLHPEMHGTIIVRP